MGRLRGVFESIRLLGAVPYVSKVRGDFDHSDWREEGHPKEFIATVRRCSVISVRGPAARPLTRPSISDHHLPEHDVEPQRPATGLVCVPATAMAAVVMLSETPPATECQGQLGLLAPKPVFRTPKGHSHHEAAPGIASCLNWLNDSTSCFRFKETL
jgi:hypothetical protein